jgi:hypothetical protein
MLYVFLKSIPFAGAFESCSRRRVLHFLRFIEIFAQILYIMSRIFDLRCNDECLFLRRGPSKVPSLKVPWLTMVNWGDEEHKYQTHQNYQNYLMASVFW